MRLIAPLAICLALLSTFGAPARAEPESYIFAEEAQNAKAKAPPSSSFAIPNSGASSAAAAFSDASSKAAAAKQRDMRPALHKAAAAKMPAKALALKPRKPPTAAKPRRKPKPVRLYASINLSRQQMTVSVDGKFKHSWPISSGRSGYATPTGSYKPYRMHKMWYSRKYDNAPMPHAVFYSGGFAVHATYATKRLGRPASHGCIRLSPGSARKFYALVRKYGKSSTKIAISGRAPARSRTASRRTASRRTASRRRTVRRAATRRRSYNARSYRRRNARRRYRQSSGGFLDSLFQ